MTALLVAAHGDGDGSKSNLSAKELAARAASLGGFQEYGLGFQKGEPPFSRAIDELASDRVVVVPLMASAGYYSRTVLPRELRRNNRFHQVRVQLAEPVGTHPGLSTLAELRVREQLNNLGWEPGKTSVMVVGHGTRRHRDSRLSTERLCSELAQRLPLHEVVAAFLDERPGPEEAVRKLAGPRRFILPFLMGAGTHATRDLPRRLRTDELHIDLPLGAAPGMEHLILLRAKSRTLEGARK